MYADDDDSREGVYIYGEYKVARGEGCKQELVYLQQRRGNEATAKVIKKIMDVARSCDFKGPISIFNLLHAEQENETR